MMEDLSVKNTDEDEFSSDAEDDKSFIQKIGGLLFFGCGGGKDKEEKSN